MEAVVPDRQLAGRYTLLELIGAGGMATVWRAEDDVLARVVAVKVLLDHLSEGGELLDRFRREAVAAARLAHPNLVRVFDAGMDAGHAFIVMEYVPGETLHDLVARTGSLDPSVAADLMVAVLSALSCAHASGVVHRDVKPGNILIAPGGLVKVTDFGLAAAAFNGADLATTGEMLGTVGYIAPEQIHGGEVTPATDVYSAGLVLYELLTGRPAFRGETHLATALARLTTRPSPPSAVKPGIPRGLDQIVARATALQPEDRYQSADAMRAALERFGGGSDRPHLPAMPSTDLPAAPPSRSGLRAWLFIPLAVLAVAAAVISAGLAFGRLSLGGPLGIRAASPKPSAPAVAALRLVPIAAAHDEDPQGRDGREHPELVGRAIDGNPGTWWTTDHYRTAAFGNLKTGVGLWLDFGTTADVRTVTITSPVPGWTFQLFGTPDPSGAPLSSPGGRTSFSANEGTVTVTLRPERSAGVLVWITRLAADGNGFAATIAEVSVRGGTG